ncbi:MAG: hypothetical protein DM484_26010 [Candidatus Methylumidiphilus alinenensis]|uniref:Uncharacterized protein n=1 Tax=Candidatus Methylumidiphilus alinenensis TaxID=2202197 RepID=A0A2W4QH95_9GAMM|nr:MAG: hypothetical protein DM484_26010 [Candidatus Methylumidiphilus alinenensis]
MPYDYLVNPLTRKRSLPPGSAGVSPAEMVAKMTALPGKSGGVNAYVNPRSAATSGKANPIKRSIELQTIPIRIGANHE